MTAQPGRRRPGCLLFLLVVAALMIADCIWVGGTRD